MPTQCAGMQNGRDNQQYSLQDGFALDNLPCEDLAAPQSAAVSPGSVPVRR
ncbi:hypothetical protein BCL67_102108 [Nesterenkonia sandarakina]|uniref:Uncharacterized protein n=1 Tax=Nesterenkonia sandarakina TaxID=272918 RepID=A0A2T0YRZ7_9MICC|nr:hypothetical protein BCL67_102108 [Nesterenkonia sandarakina]